MWLNPGPGIWGAGGRVPSMTDSQRGFRAQRKQNLARQNFMNGGLLAITAREIQNMCQCNAICMHSSLFLHTEHNLSFFKKNIKIYSTVDLENHIQKRRACPSAPPFPPASWNGNALFADNTTK